LCWGLWLVAFHASCIFLLFVLVLVRAVVFLWLFSCGTFPACAHLFGLSLSRLGELFNLYMEASSLMGREGRGG